MSSHTPVTGRFTAAAGTPRVVQEGAGQRDVLDVLVAEGDVISKDQPLCEIETDKATVPIPSSHAGKVLKVHVSAGDSVPVGGTLVTLEAS